MDENANLCLGALAECCRGNDWYKKDFVNFMTAKPFWPCEHSAQRQSTVEWALQKSQVCTWACTASPQALKETCVFTDPVLL